MADLILNNFSKTVSIIATEEEKLATPSWFGELTLLSHLWVQSGLISELNKRVKVARGRMGVYEVVDFVLLLLAYCVSQENTLKLFFRITRPFKSALAALWNRDRSPSASALSRFLDDVTFQSVSELRKLLFADLLHNGIKLEYIGGLYDRTACRHILFDIDATRDAARQRSVPTCADYPPVHRRRSNYARGYSGRKRGEVVRSRTTVQQAHTQEWLGTFGSAGNGDIWKELEQSCQLINAYMQAKGLKPSQALARLDGAYGWARGSYICEQNSVGCLCRCCDYKLLEMAEIKQSLESSAAEDFYQVDTNCHRRLYDLGFINWQGGKDKSINVRTRLIVACSDAPPDGSKPRVGKLQGQKVYELFITSCAPNQLTVRDVVSLYYGRGGFEQTLSFEDQEQDPDRFCSQNQAGQEFWQLLAQWVWNARLRLGFAAQTPDARRTIWAEAINLSETVEPSHNEMSPIEKSAQSGCEATQLEKANPEQVLPNSNKEITAATQYCTNSSAPSPAEMASGKIKMARPTREALRKFSADKFLVQSDGTLKCPAEKTLRPGERRKELEQIRIVYQAGINDCRNCHLVEACRIDNSATRGRRVSLLLPLSTTEIASAQLPQPADQQNLVAISRVSIENSLPYLPLGSEPVYWTDLPASSLRHLLPNLLRAQQIEITMPDLPISSNVVVLTRDERAHRRLTWARRLKRNAAPHYSSPWRFHIYGLPQKVTAYLSSISTLAA